MADPTVPTATAATPRFIKGPNDSTVYDTAGGFLDPVLNPADFAARSGSNDIAGHTTVVDNPQSYLQDTFLKQAQQRFLPQQETALQGIDQSRQQLNQNEAGVNDVFASALNQMLERQNQLGLLSSGSTAGLNAKSAVDKATALAQIALQRAGLSTQEASVKQQTGNSINDMVSQLLSGSTQAQKNATDSQIQLQQLAQTIPLGQTVSIGGKTITGTMAPKLSTVDLGNKVVLMDQSGKIVQSYSKGLTPSEALTAGSGNYGSTNFNPAKSNQNDLDAAIKAAMASGNYSSDNKSNTLTREALIQNLTSAFAGSKFKPSDIASSVYSEFRNPGEGVFAGLSPEQIKNFNSPGTTSATQQKDNTAVQVALGGLDKLTKSANAVGFNGSRLSTGFAKAEGSNIFKSLSGQSADITNLQTAQADLIAAIKAITGSARITQQELDAIKIDPLKDNLSQMQTKINQYKDLLKTSATASGIDLPDSVVNGGSGSGSSSSGALTNIWGF